MSFYLNPSNWFWIFMAILLSCYLKIASQNHNNMQAIPASITNPIFKIFDRS